MKELKADPNLVLIFTLYVVWRSSERKIDRKREAVLRRLRK